MRINLQDLFITTKVKIFVCLIKNYVMKTCKIGRLRQVKVRTGNNKRRERRRSNAVENK